MGGPGSGRRATLPPPTNQDEELAVALIEGSESGATPTETEETGELHLIALNPAQMQSAQSKLQAWAVAKSERELSRMKELQENYDLAVKRKWKSSLILLHLKIAEKRSLFFSKLAEAVGEGYYLVPDMPMDTFTVRSKQKQPTYQARSYTGSHQYGWPNIFDEKPKQLPSGVGENRNPSQYVSHFEGKPHKDESGKEVFTRTTEASAWAPEIDFPFVLAKPQVLEATDRAMRLKIFDELGVLPQTAKKDPMVLGRIHGPKGLSATFLIAWFLDEEHFK